MEKLAHALWSQWSKSESHLPSLSHKTTCEEIPYCNNSGKALCVLEGSGADCRASADIFECHICHAAIKPERMRLHTGFRILAGECGPSPCGFCGRSHQCSVGLKATKKAKVPTSDRSYFRKFSIKSAESVSDKAPCTNRPVGCPACSDKEFMT